MVEMDLEGILEVEMKDRTLDERSEEKQGFKDLQALG